jgi:hypothetical protein
MQQNSIDLEELQSMKKIIGQMKLSSLVCAKSPGKPPAKLRKTYDELTAKSSRQERMEKLHAVAEFIGGSSGGAKALIEDCAKKSEDNIPTQSIDLGLAVLVKIGVTENKYKGLRLLLPNILPSYYAIRKMDLELADKFGFSKDISGEGEEEDAESAGVFMVGSVEKLVETRFWWMMDSGMLTIDDRDELLLEVSLDKGDISTKICISFVQASNPQNPWNFSLLALYTGQDDHVGLSKCLPIFQQLTALNGKLMGGLTVKLFLCADLKGMASVLGLQGGAAKFRCPFCYWEVDHLNNTVENYDFASFPEARTLESREKDWSNFHAVSNPTAKTNQQNHSVKGVPLLKLPNSHLVPPALHNLNSPANAYIEELNTLIPAAMKTFCKNVKVTFSYKGHQFVGPDVTTMLKNIDQLMPHCRGNEEAEKLIKLLKLLYAIHPFAVVGKLSTDQISGLKNSIEAYCKFLADHFPKMKMSTHNHVLHAHVVPFVQEHCLWGSAGEQGLEAKHHQSKKDTGKTTGVNERKLAYTMKVSIRSNYLYDNGFCDLHRINV